MSNSIKDINYHLDINSNFSQNVYVQMVSKRYGIKFCCNMDLRRYEIKKELLDLNDIMDKNLTPIICT